MAEITLEGVTKQFGSVTAVHRFSLEIADAEFVVFVGPSGCGKSTTLRMLAGLEEITAGTISIDGKVVNNVHPKNRDIAMVFQNYALYPHLSVFDNISFGLRAKKLPKSEIQQRTLEAAGILGLTDLLARRPGELSGGQKQRVAMGRAIVRKPKVFLFDEPLSNLDAKLRHKMRAEMKKLHQQVRTTTIYVTHDQVEAMTLADRIVIMKDGHIEQVGSPDEVYQRPQSQFVAGFIGSPKMNFVTGATAEAYGASTIGIRPEHIDVSAQGGTWRGVVGVSEHLGSDSFFHIHGTGIADMITVRADGEVGFKHGDDVFLTPREDAIHKFDAQGLRLE
ncbi:MAG: sn-glycerol-3-phosphate ABC transporter ATP-binding protein UgpC [Rhodobacteraceae bacterium]|nr:sn-glycerol-3-phosphate ABC transporter ATP-binding protein UgpC [Paracoccaceae bacterium]